MYYDNTENEKSNVKSECLNPQMLCKTGVRLAAGASVHSWDWHVAQNYCVIPFTWVIKRDIRIVIFYLKLQITLLNEMLQLLFVPRRHLCGYLLVV